MWLHYWTMFLCGKYCTIVQKLYLKSFQKASKYFIDSKNFGKCSILCSVCSYSFFWIVLIERKFAKCIYVVIVFWVTTKNKETINIPNIKHNSIFQFYKSTYKSQWTVVFLENTCKQRCYQNIRINAIKYHPCWCLG